LSGLCYFDNGTAANCASNIVGAMSVDPLMIGVLAQSLGKLSGVTLFTLSMASSVAAIVANISLMTDVVSASQNERHAQNMCITFSFGAAFALFVTAITTRATISASIHAVEAVALGRVVVTRGVLLEVFVWVSSAIWFLVFLSCVYIRRWELQELG
jgi:hypothetical protein